MTEQEMSGLSGSIALVTGAGGFIGSHLAAGLCAAGAQVVGFSRQAPKMSQAGVRHVEGDLADAGQIAGLVAAVKPEYVFHLASLKNKTAAIDDFREGIRNDVLGTLNLVEACLQAGKLRRFVHLGSCEVYGRIEVPFTEVSREAPVSAYSFSKAAVSHLLQALGRLHDFASVELRPSLVYGPGQDQSMFVPALVGSLLAGRHFAMSKGEQTRDFVYVDDVVEAMLLAAVNPDCAGEVINVCSASPVGIRQVAEMAAGLIRGDAPGLLGVGELPYRPAEAMAYWADNHKAQAVLGWKPRVSLAEGLARTVDYYRTDMQQGTV